MTKAKVLSMYFLRFIRIREFRRKLLDMMNYFVSIEKRLNLDCHACNRGSFSRFPPHSLALVLEALLQCLVSSVVPILGVHVQFLVAFH